LNISFDGPVPDYAGIAKAASAGWVWTGRASTKGEFDLVLKEAVENVKAGRTAVVDCSIKGFDPTDSKP
jgi:hypothetical protein